MAETQQRVSAKDAAIAVLRAAQTPLATKELAKRVLAKKGVKLTGKTPEATIAAMLAVSNKKGGPFVRTAPGIYGLRDSAVEDEPKGDEPEPAAEPEGEPEQALDPEAEVDADLRKAASAADANARKAAGKREAKPHPKPSAKNKRGRAKATA